MKNNFYQHLLILCSISFLAACSSSYPEKGSGGLAENDFSAGFSPVLPDEPLGPEHGLRFDWQINKLHLDMLVQEGAKWCFPAAVVQNQERQNRIARELEGNLLLDAANDLIIQRKSLNKLEQQLTYVTSQADCTPPNNQENQQQELTTINTLFTLLNVDNQFAHNSSEINPKYMGNLAQAANILDENNELTLSITGHADASGSVDYNEKLALDRANQVKRYLSIFGLNPKRINASSLGSSAPLFQGDTAAVQLTNRRVSVEILSKSNTSASTNPRGLL
ncbi:OmpA family protein [Vibrio algarum]|uniref:OmpA family protein n=1 Tax=Vibrio algarum TaxID=3020714 RepID=A0ABT4YWG5_9VIBR|nr:OmpA family protein [Vibrio sp. KJ40-1]MDB1125732.1 OmpA family protein [Vibrio sp. KJ40-1]